MFQILYIEMNPKCSDGIYALEFSGICQIPINLLYNNLSIYFSKHSTGKFTNRPKFETSTDTFLALFFLISLFYSLYIEVTLFDYLQVKFTCNELMILLEIDVDDLFNPGRRVVHTLYVYNSRPGLGCSLTSIGLDFFSKIP